SCFYIPPSLRSRAVARTPPPGTRSALVDQQGVKRYPGALPNSKPTNYFPSPKVQPSSGDPVDLSYLLISSMNACIMSDKMV
ncbi:cyclin-dependent kinase F-4-like, partial [Trifolium medium]|nr:cyclin-dependent kinase F-4-like [Trifolium medium]